METHLERAGDTGGGGGGAGGVSSSYSSETPSDERQLPVRQLHSAQRRQRDGAIVERVDTPPSYKDRGAQGKLDFVYQQEDHVQPVNSDCSFLSKCPP